MVYIMKIHVDGGCRGNGTSSAIGAAAAAMVFRYGRNAITSNQLPSTPSPTSQRAELSAVLLGLDMAFKRFQRLRNSPKLKITISSDSKYAVNSINDWLHPWIKNGWINARGEMVKNKDLFERILADLASLRLLGKVRIVWVPRERNASADECCNKVLDKLECQRD